jgi:type II secretory ATPase GspE/PulE/Tfp pilus assembly ATPase PilB-like protein/FixJ family two-component response regulator
MTDSAAQVPLILCIDDSPDILLLAKMILKKAGYRVITACGVQEAIPLLTQERPQLILLDIVMPEMDGYTLCRKFQGYPAMSNIPVIFVSGQLNTQEDQLKAFQAGGVDFIQKPFNREDLLAKVSYYLDTGALWKQKEEKTGAVVEKSAPDVIKKDITAFRARLATALGLNAELLQAIQALELPEIYQFLAQQHYPQERVTQCLGELMEWPVLDSVEAAWLKLGLFPLSFIRSNGILPLQKSADQPLLFGIANPFDLSLFDILKRYPESQHLLISPDLLERSLHLKSGQRASVLPETSQSGVGADTSASTGTDLLSGWLDGLPTAHTEASVPSHAPVAKPASSALDLSEWMTSITTTPAPSAVTPKTSGTTAESLPKNSSSPAVASVQGLLPLPVLQKLERDLQEDTVYIKMLVNALLENACRLNATHIHIEALAGDLRIRYRIAGKLQEMHRLTPARMLLLISMRLKQMAGVDKNVRRKPHHCRFRFRLDSFQEERYVDLRLSFLPEADTENIVIRISDPVSDHLTLFDFSFAPSTHERYLKGLLHYSGLILHVGPMESGKSSVLYAALQEHLNTAERKIISMARLNRSLPGVVCIQTDTEMRLSFQTLAKAVLQHDPDVILMEEIREREAAQFAVESAVTGHLVLATMQTYDAVSALLALIEMGVPSFMVGSALVMICAQRLLRRLCPDCRESYQAEPHEKQVFNLPASESLMLFRAKGCVLCRETGYRGHLGIQEILLPSEALREGLSQAPYQPDTIRQLALNTCHMVPLYADALFKVMSGDTSFEELHHAMIAGNHAHAVQNG